MSRPKAPIPVDVAFYARTTKGERTALNALVEQWQRERAGESGFMAPGDNVGAWFRAMIHRLAAEKAIPIEEQAPPHAQAAASSTASAGRKVRAKK